MHMLLKNVYCYIQPRPYPTVSPRRQARISERRGSSSYPRWAFPFRFVLTFSDPFIKLPKWDAKGWLVRHFLFLCASSEHIILCTYFSAYLSLHIIHFAHDPFCISIHSARHPFCISSILHIICFALSYILHIICFALSSILHIICFVLSSILPIICFALSFMQVAEFWLLGVPRTSKPFEGRMADQVLSWKLKTKMQNAKCKIWNTNCKIQNSKCKMQNAKCKVQNAK